MSGSLPYKYYYSYREDADTSTVQFSNTDKPEAELLSPDLPSLLSQNLITVGLLVVSKKPVGESCSIACFEWDEAEAGTQLLR